MEANKNTLVLNRRDGQQIVPSPKRRKMSRRKTGRWKVSKEDIKEALDMKFGVVSEAAKALGMSYGGLYKRIAESAELQIAQAEGCSKMVDTAEHHLVKALKMGERWAVERVLDSKGRDRGWMKQTGVNIPNLPAGQVVFNVVPADENARIERDKANKGNGHSHTHVEEQEEVESILPGEMIEGDGDSSHTSVLQ